VRFRRLSTGPDSVDSGVILSVIGNFVQCA
jgi:hypothetical protein